MSTEDQNIGHRDRMADAQVSIETCRTCGGPGFVESQGEYYPCGSCNATGINRLMDSNVIQSKARI